MRGLRIVVLALGPGLFMAFDGLRALNVGDSPTSRCRTRHVRRNGFSREVSIVPTKSVAAKARVQLPRAVAALASDAALWVFFRKGSKTAKRHEP